MGFGMPKRSNEFQKLVYLVRVNLAGGAKVSESKMFRDRLTGTEREVDVCVEGIVGGTPVTVCLECRDHVRPADVTWVEEMKSKHERLPTHALILASRSGFTKEAREVARLSGIKAISFDEIERTDMHELLKGKSSLWHKFMTISPERVVVEVLPTPVLPAENVSVLIDHALFAADGSPVGIMGSLVQQAVTPEVVREYLAHGEEKHRWFQLRWDQPRNQHGNAFFSRCLNL